MTTRLRAFFVTVALASGLVVIAAALASPSSVVPSLPAQPAAARPADAITALQERLVRVPGDWTAWAALGMAYVDRARLTYDPAWLGKAEGAFGLSLRVRPRDNAVALTGQATLAAARHDFVAARRLALSARALDPYDATTYGVLGDALVELGRYDEAFAAFQRMADLRPGVPSYTRASYAWELRGDTARAAAALRAARTAATRPADVAFAELHLGELAWNAGDLATARTHYAAARRADPANLPALAGLARLDAARSEIVASATVARATIPADKLVADAIVAYATIVEALPTTGYVVEYGELLAAAGRTADAEAQFAVARAGHRLLAAQGVAVDLEQAVFEADHGDAAAALRAARSVWRTRRGVFAADAYGWALHANGRDREALRYADDALRLGTRSALLHFHRGAILHALGRAAEARADMREALRINPYFSWLYAPAARRLAR